ncbi:MAG: hypothetical protein MJ102_05970 [Clostridia bacterium]|nr:hypothetical protein [Clostridia bacterium]
MFFQYVNGPVETDIKKLKKNTLTAGYLSPDELEKVYGKFGFSESTVASCRRANKYFRSGVEIYGDYTFTELRVIDVSTSDDDCVALYIKKDLIIVVDVEDTDGSTKSKFMGALNRYTAENVTLEKIIYSFLDSLIAGDIKVIEQTGTRLSELEEQLIEKKPEHDFELDLLKTKKQLLLLRNYYEQILDITESIDENENDLFDSDCLMYINNISKRVERLREDVDSLKNTVEHLQDAYSTFLDAELNNTTKILTVISTIFFPLTIIVGWYGMNFKYMPEFDWKYGYVYVIALSVVVVAILTLIGKKKKWF